MFTRCPHCEVAHPVSASLLAHAGGSVRCGSCGKSFNALAFLFDQWPRPGAKASPLGANANPPVLGGTGRPAPVIARNERNREPVAKVAATGKPMWQAVVTILLLVTIAHLAWTFRAPLLENELIRTLAEGTGLLEVRDTQPYRDASRIRLVSRDMHLHPTRAGILVLSATFVSLADQGQPFPDLGITLTDADNRPLAARQFQPDEYLPAGVDADVPLAPQVHVPILLEFADPGDKAVGFEVSFR